jgi:glycosyltransferase involved in cell wall biosynthesis
VVFLNEEGYLPAFLDTLVAQTRRPDALLLVDDGSTDDSAAIAEAFAAEHTWATFARRPVREIEGDRLDGAPELEAFLWGVGQTDPEHDVVIKMDADLELAPEHFATVMGAFEADDRLGIAGTYLHAHDSRGRRYLERHPAEHVRGPTRFYRRRCLEDILPLPFLTAWDGADEVRARARGWRTHSVDLPGEPSLHMRRTGGHDGRLLAHKRWGRGAYVLGTHPLALTAGATARARHEPRVIGGLAYIWGFIDAHRDGVPRMPDDIRAAKRREDLVRLRRVVTDLPARLRR